MTPLRLSLSAAILSALALVLIVTWFLLGVVSYKTTERNLYAQKADEGRLLMAALTHLLPEEIAATKDSPVVARFVETLALDQEFRDVAITDATGPWSLPRPSRQESTGSCPRRCGTARRLSSCPNATIPSPATPRYLPATERYGAQCG